MICHMKSTCWRVRRPSSIRFARTSSLAQLVSYPPNTNRHGVPLILSTLGLILRLASQRLQALLVDSMAAYKLSFIKEPEYGERGAVQSHPMTLPTKTLDSEPAKTEDVQKTHSWSNSQLMAVFLSDCVSARYLSV